MENKILGFWWKIHLRVIFQDQTWSTARLKSMYLQFSKMAPFCYSIHVKFTCHVTCMTIRKGPESREGRMPCQSALSKSGRKLFFSFLLFSAFTSLNLALKLLKFDTFRGVLRTLSVQYSVISITLSAYSACVRDSMAKTMIWLGLFTKPVCLSFCCRNLANNLFSSLPFGIFEHLKKLTNLWVIWSLYAFI